MPKKQTCLNPSTADPFEVQRREYANSINYVRLKF